MHCFLDRMPAAGSKVDSTIAAENERPPCLAWGTASLVKKACFGVVRKCMNSLPNKFAVSMVSRVYPSRSSRLKGTVHNSDDVCAKKQSVAIPQQILSGRVMRISHLRRRLGLDLGVHPISRSRTP